MKKIVYILIACIFAVASCDKIDSLLDTKNYQKADTSSFPQTEKDAEQLVNSAYSTMHSLYTGSIFRINLFRRMIASDDLYGGGSTSSKETTAADRPVRRRFHELQGDDRGGPSARPVDGRGQLPVEELL